MQNSSITPETLWDHLLSRDRNYIQAAFNWLAQEEKQAVLDHLHSMSSEPDWHPEQRESARVALGVLGQYRE